MKSTVPLIIFLGLGILETGCSQLIHTSYEKQSVTESSRAPSIPSGSIMAVCPRDNETIYYTKCSNCGAEGGLRNKIVRIPNYTPEIGEIFKGQGMNVIQLADKTWAYEHRDIVECSRCEHPVMSLRHDACGTTVMAKFFKFTL